VFIQDTVVNIVMSYGLDSLAFDSLQGPEVSSLKPSRLALMLTLHPVQWVLDFYPGGKATGMSS
jgi:hypothetical protein